MIEDKRGSKSCSMIEDKRGSKSYSMIEDKRDSKSCNIEDKSGSKSFTMRCILFSPSYKSYTLPMDVARQSLTS